MKRYDIETLQSKFYLSHESSQGRWVLYNDVAELIKELDDYKETLKQAYKLKDHWRRKAKKLQNEMNRLRFLIEQQPNFRYKSSWLQTVINYLDEIKKKK